MAKKPSGTTENIATNLIQQRVMHDTNDMLHMLPLHAHHMTCYLWKHADVKLAENGACLEAWHDSI